MNYEYLKEQQAIREQEIKDGDNLATFPPVYVVLSLVEHFCSGHDDFISSATNHKDKSPEYGYIDMGEVDEREFMPTNEEMKKPREVTKFYTDRPIAFFITSKSAHAYTKYQAHNMNEPYVYVFSTGYANHQMEKIHSNGKK